MKVRVIAVGKGESAFAPLETEYQQRSRAFPVELVELKGRGEDAEARKREGEDLLARLPERGLVIALDEGGDLLSSRAFADLFADAQRHAQPWVSLLLGGASGFDPAVRARAHRTISLSRLTFPHRLARLVLLEQLYRASSLLRGEPYHK
jgi:23S rRNA (pseudouridine1915-N3)-methyltransferase